MRFGRCVGRYAAPMATGAVHDQDCAAFSVLRVGFSFFIWRGCASVKDEPDE